MNVIYEWSCLISELNNPIDDSYDKWLSDNKIEHDLNHDNKITEEDYSMYLESLINNEYHIQ